MRYPLDNVHQTSPFGIRSFDKFHYGEDLRASIGTPFYSIADGECVISKLNYGSPSRPGYGEYIVIEHTREDGSKFCSNFVHLSKRIVKRGQSVREGQLLGYTGNTPDYRNLSPHLHWEIRDCEYGAKFWEKTYRNGRKVPKYCVDPVKFMEENMASVDIRIKTSGKLIEKCDEDTVDKLSAYLDPFEKVLYKYCGRVLKYGMWKSHHKEDVLELQKAYKKLGFTIELDGKYGGDTRKITEKFQKSKGVNVSGEVDEKLANLINTDLNKL